jgi:hypothetical protein
MYVNYAALNAVFYHFNFISSSRGCAHVAQRLGIKNTGLLSKSGAKIVSKPLLVFLGK